MIVIIIVVVGFDFTTKKPTVTNYFTLPLNFANFGLISYFIPELLKKDVIFFISFILIIIIIIIIIVVAIVVVVIIIIIAF